MNTSIATEDSAFGGGTEMEEGNILDPTDFELISPAIGFKEDPFLATMSCPTNSPLVRL